MRTTKKKSLLVALCALSLVVAGAIPAVADDADNARGSAFGISLTGLVDLGPEPLVEAAIPPGEEDRDVLLEVPLEELLYSGTAVAEADARRASTVEPNLHTGTVNGRGYAATEELSALEGDLLTADLVAAEAVATCVAGQTQFSTSSVVQNATLAGSVLPLEELQGIIDLLDPVVDGLEPLLGDSSLDVLVDQPNDVILEIPELGIRLIGWETNWDGGTGTTDGSDTVFVNALRLTITGALGDILGDQDLIVSHAEASADCDRDPLGNVSKTASQDTVAPGDTFTYTIDVPNSDDTCTLTNVRVVDTITGPAGFTITSTSPEGANVEQGDTSATVIWDDIGPIAPGEAVQLTIGVQVPTNAPDQSQFAEQLRITANCDGLEVDGGLDFTGPTVSAPAGPGGPALPRTGGAAVLVGGLALLAMGAGVLRLRG